MALVWYPHHESYYEPDPDPSEWPVRQGDVMVAPDHLGDESDDPWKACQVVHPSCEIGAKSNPKQLQVIRVVGLGEFSDPNDQMSVVQGFKLKDGEPQIAFAHTFFLPPTPGTEEPLFSDFRQIRTVPRSALQVTSRLAALTHDARVHFIRRKLYWQQRWFTELSDIYRLEGHRIALDQAFVGSKPAWAALAG